MPDGAPSDPTFQAHPTCLTRPACYASSRVTTSMMPDDLLKTFKDGATNDDAFQQVYGFDALGYENEWRAAVGLDPRTASATPTPEPARGFPRDGRCLRAGARS